MWVNLYMCTAKQSTSESSKSQKVENRQINELQRMVTTIHYENIVSVLSVSKNLHKLGLTEVLALNRGAFFGKRKKKLALLFRKPHCFVKFSQWGIIKKQINESKCVCIACADRAEWNAKNRCQVKIEMQKLEFKYGWVCWEADRTTAWIKCIKQWTTLSTSFIKGCTV